MVWTQFTTGTDPKIEKLTFGFYWRCLFDWWMVNLLEAGTHLNCHDFWGQLQKYLCTCRYVLLYYKRESLDTYIGVECASICATPIYQLSCQEFEKRIQDTSWSTSTMEEQYSTYFKRLFKTSHTMHFLPHSFCFSVSQSAAPLYEHVFDNQKESYSLRNINCRFEYWKKR